MTKDPTLEETFDGFLHHRTPGPLDDRFRNSMAIADGACAARSRREEEDDALPSSTTTNEEIARNPVCPTGCASEYEPRLSPVQTSTSDTFSSIYGRNNCHVISESII